MDSIKMTTEQQLPKGWKKTTLGEISIVKMGQSPNGKSYNKEKEGYLLIGGASDLGDIYPSPKQYTNEATKLSKANDIIICIRATIGRLNLSDKVYCLGRGVAGIEVNANVEAKFIWYSLMNSETYLLKNSTGTTFQQVSSHTLKKLPIVYPTSKETQQAIVNKIESLFAEIDAGIDSLKTAAQQIQQYRQSLLKNAFNGELTKEWRSKHADTLPSENELLAQIQTTCEQHHAQQLADWQTAVSQWEQNGKEGKKPSKPKAPTQAVKFEENFADLPRGWFNFSLDTLAEISGGLTKNAKRGSFKEKVPYLRVANVYANELKLDEIATIGIQENEKARTLLKTNDLLIVEGNGSIEQIGRVAIWNNTINPCYHQNHLIKARCYPFVLPKFALYFLISPMGRERIINVASSTTGLHTLSLTKVANLIIPVCSLAEQTEIVAILESKLTACDQLAAELSKQLKQAELLKQAVLKAAFSGSLLDK
ncbi:restriction endonuclease subunit S [Neisseria polysaccharea]|uniref:restriction endonuclease subunit S n=2 Tax=Neisseria polysaccharea TaxID=489 RepID=UPI00272DAC43|nr:restriction endonuclease subunit S [Neisseria polysaccharea]